MKRQPALLAHVIKAIADLKDHNGSSTKNIIGQVRAYAAQMSPLPRNLTMQVRSALRHGLDTGLLKHRGGKYRLGLDARDYATYRNFKKLGVADYPYRQHRRRRRKGKKSRRRRRRSHDRMQLLDAGYGGYSSEEDSLSDIDSDPYDRGGRRRKGRRKGRRRRRRHHEAYSLKRGRSPVLKDRKDDDHRDRSHSRFDYDNSNECPDVMTCDNPECLCNLAQQEVARGSSEEIRDP